MSWITGARARLRQLLWRSTAEERMDEEIRFHIEMETEKNLRAGMRPEEARRRAMLAFGGVEGHKEEMRQGRQLPLLEHIWRDVRYAARSLRKTPVFTAAAVLTVAIGVGANTAVFGLVSATLLRPLPFPASERLVALFQAYEGAGQPPHPMPWSYPEFAALRSALTSFSHLAAYYSADTNLSGTGAEPTRIGMEMVSASYFPVLGIPPLIGRAFLPQEDSIPGARPVAIIGQNLWEREFGSEPEIVGREILLNGVSVTVVGVMPRGFRGLTGDGEVWIPHAMAPAVYFPNHLTTAEQFLSVVARLRPGVSTEQARAEVAAGTSAAAAARERSGVGQEGRWSAALLPLEEARRDPATVRAQLVLAGAVFFVMLIAAVNVAGLLLARAIGRSREFAVRAALGARRRRLVQQALVESGLVGLLGGALAVLIAVGSIRVLSAIAPARLGGTGPRVARLDPFASPETDWRVIVFAAVLAVAAGLLAGLVPALRATRGDLTGALKAGARGSTVGVGSLRRPTVLSWIAVAQVACALVLLVGAGLLMKGFHGLRSLDLGLDAAGVVTFHLNPPESTYGGPAAGELLQRVLERVEAVPGVTSATVGRCLPGTGCSSSPLYIAGRPGVDRPPVVRRHYVGPDHFRTLGIPVLRGRGLTSEDRAGRARVAVVNETAARRFWPNEDPIGARVWFGSGGGFASPDSLTEIIGVVGDVRYGAPGEEIQPDFYTSYLQFVLPATMVMVRTTGDPVALVPSLRRAVAEVDPNLPIHNVRTVAQVQAESLEEARFATVALGTFAGLGLLLAALGVYGVMAYSVAQRRREIGIRIALGAPPRAVLRQVIGHGAALAGLGLAAGSLVSLWLSRTLPALIADIGSADPLILAVVASTLFLVALLTCYLAARPAARVDPVEALAAD
jgi:putative ABC transport system permease protein